MFKKYFALTFANIISHFFRDKIRHGSIQTVKFYIKSVRFARLGLVGLIGLGAISALFVAGVVLTIVGIIGVLPLEPATRAIMVLVIGVLLTAIVGIGLALTLSQKRWLELSKSYELMDAALAPWPGPLPPNPAEVIRRPKAAREPILSPNEMSVAKQPMIGDAFGGAPIPSVP